METVFEELMKVTELELVYKPKIRASERMQVKTAGDAYRIFKRSWDLNKMDLCEQAKMLLLNKANKVLGIIELSCGGAAATIIDPRIVFGAALKANASYILLAHNHPSGNLRPSQQDEAVTQKIKTAGALLEIKLIDHLIITSDAFLSMADEGIL